MKIRFGKTAAALFFAASCAVIRAQDAVTATAPAVLQKMVESYAALTSYSDHNSVLYRNADGSERLQVEFRIWLVRPSSFRVDAESKSPAGGAVPRREVIWTDGGAVRSWVSGKAVTTKPKVQLAGSGMFGTYAYHVPTLLEPSYAKGQRLEEMASPTLAEDETLEGVECFHLQGMFNGDPYEIWIAKTDHLVRKIHAKYHDHELDEIHREIVVNQPIARDIFYFAPENQLLPGERSTKEKIAPKK
ncbi:MAG: DUF2092 domain-containing protein [Chthoniobacterales bacterium]